MIDIANISKLAEIIGADFSLQIADNVPDAFKQAIFEDPAPVPGSSISDLIDSMLSRKDSGNAVQKLFAAAVKIAQEKGLPGFESMTPEATAIAVDNVISTFKTSRQLENGDISIEEAAERIADKATVALKIVVEKIAKPEMLAKGLNCMIDMISQRCPATQACKPYVAAISKLASERIRRSVNDGMPKIKETIKNTIIKTARILQGSLSRIEQRIIDIATA